MSIFHLRSGYRSHRIATLAMTTMLALVLTGCAYQLEMHQADRHFNQGDYESALMEYRSARVYKPDSPEVTEKITLVRQTLLAQWTRQIEQSRQARDFDRSLDVAAHALRTLPNEDRLRQLGGQVVADALEVARQQEATGDFANAIFLMERVREQLPDVSGDAALALIDLRYRWASRLCADAATDEQSGLSGSALLRLAKASRLIGDPDTIVRAESLAHRLNREIIYRVRTDVSGMKHAGGLLFQELRDDNDRSRIEYRDRAQKDGRANAHLRIQLTQPEFQSQTTMTQNAVNYQSGLQRLPNPDFPVARQRFAAEDRRLDRFERELRRSRDEYEHHKSRYKRDKENRDLKDRYRRAEKRYKHDKNAYEEQRRIFRDIANEVERIPPYIDEPIFDQLIYPVTVHMNTAVARLNAMIEHTDGRAPIAFETELVASATDEEAEAQPIAGIPADHVSLPDRRQLTDQLRTRAAHQIRQMVEDSFADYRQSTLNSAQMAASPESQIHHFVRYALIGRDDTPEDIYESLARLSGIPDARQLMQDLPR